MITVITGGTGSIKLVRGLDSVLDEKMTIITNVGDNIWLFGLYICPDIDTILYGLSGQLDQKKGWGIYNDTFNWLTSMNKFSDNIWFRIGDKDLDIHRLRTKLFKNGMKLSEITKLISNRMNIKHQVIPASNHSIETTITTNDRQMHLQEFWVKNKGNLPIKDVTYKGIEIAEPTDNVVNIIKNSDKIIIAPGNPISSIGPTIAITKLKKSLKESNARKIALSPIIRNKPISGPAGKMMKAKGYSVSNIGVAKFYSDFIDELVIDSSDTKYMDKITKMGIKVHQTQILMKDSLDEIELAKFIISDN